ncbi:putative dehydrogenase [Bacillus sp. TS-2]|nr:putative dehydrogenase [Bacillus sp. TS-2]
MNMSTNKCYRVGIIGAGNVTRMHLDGLKKNENRVKVTAICDPNSETLKERADFYNIEQRYTNLDDFIENSQVEVVIVCTPSVIRKEVIFPLIEAGIPIFCEKPFTETLKEAVEIDNMAKKYNVPISINQNFRSHYPFHFIRNLIAENHIGDITAVHFRDIFYRQDQGWRTQCERNSMSVMGVHWFDGFRLILNSEAKSLVCQTHSSPNVQCVGDTDAAVQILFQNGVTVSYIQSFSSSYGSNQLIIIGTSGTIVADYNDISLFEVGAKNPVKTWKDPQGGQDLKADSAFNGLNELLISIENNENASNSCEDNLKTISLLEAAYISSQDQRIVYFKPDGILEN